MASELLAAEAAAVCAPSVLHVAGIARVAAARAERAKEARERAKQETMADPAERIAEAWSQCRAAEAMSLRRQAAYCTFAAKRRVRRRLGPAPSLNAQ